MLQGTQALSTKYYLGNHGKVPDPTKKFEESLKKIGCMDHFS